MTKICKYIVLSHFSLYWAVLSISIISQQMIGHITQINRKISYIQWWVQTKMRPKGPKKIFFEARPPLSQGLDDRPPLIWRSGSATDQWWIQGRGTGAWAPLIFRPKWGPKGRKNFFWGRAPPYLMVWMTRAPPYLKVWIATDIPLNWGNERVF